jgi:hypothetical protein
MDPIFLEDVEAAAKAGPAGGQFAAMEQAGIPVRRFFISLLSNHA